MLNWGCNELQNFSISNDLLNLESLKSCLKVKFQGSARFSKFNLKSFEGVIFEYEIHTFKGISQTCA